MDALIELAGVVSKNKIKSIKTLDSQNREDRCYLFYEKLQNDEFKSDQEAADFFFNKDANHAQYRKLKSKVRDRLHNTLFFIDINNPKFSDAQRAFYQCSRDLMTIKLMIGRNARKAAFSLARQTLKHARKFELIEIVVEVLRVFRSHHAIYTGNLREYEKYRKLLAKYEETLKAENLAIQYYEDINVHLEHTLILDETIVKKANEYIDELDVYCERIKTFRLHMLKHWLSILIRTRQNRYQDLIETCDEAIRFFSKKPFFSKHFMGVFYYNKLLGLTKLRHFREGQQIAKRCLNIYEEGTTRWFRTMRLYFTLCMHTSNYKNALQACYDVVTSKGFKFQFENLHETWKLNQAYLYFLINCQAVKELKNGNIKSFRLSKFLNEVPIFSLDKRGYNIPVLIIQILMLIKQNKFDQLADRIEAIEKYTTRYLRKGDHFRTNCFIKMLLQIPKNRFHRSAVIRHTNKYMKSLRTMPIEVANQSHEIEIIPYEHLWEYTIESLGNKFR
ncbi:MAG: hypothetical protein OEQ53_16175 [Saprospiraceae bacterium]|nr:hypothetical protein [Saprospiraceae bacterium]